MVTVKTDTPQALVERLEARVAHNPKDAQAKMALALALSERRQHDRAVQLLKPLQAKRPMDHELANLLGVMHKRAGDLKAALRMLERAHRLQPLKVAPLLNAGNVHDALGDYPAAIQAYQRALVIDPKHAELWRLHARVLDLTGASEQALISNDRALALAPDDELLVQHCVQLLLKHKRYAKASTVVEQFLTLRPASLAGQVMLARITLRQGNPAQACAMLREVIAQESGHFQANMLLGFILGASNRSEANEAYRRAWAAQPNNFSALEQLIDSLSRSRHGNEVAHLEEAYALALELESRHPEQSTNAARTLRTIHGRMMDLDRLEATGHLNDLLPMWQRLGNHWAVHYELGQVNSLEDRLRLVEWHRAWGRQVTQQVQPVQPMAMPALHTGRKLRVGFMSSDLRDHPVSYFARPLLEQYNRDKVEVYCYSFYEGAQSRYQQHLESQVTRFGWWPKLPDEQVAERIAADGLDMLFELGGSSHMNKLEVMAYQPARLSASWLGYPHSAGLETIDYILVDPFLKPSDERLLIEKPFDMPHTWVTVGPHTFQHIPILPSLPEQRRGHLTFGTANNPYKYTRACIDTWAQVLRAVPGSHFLFLRPEASSPVFQANARNLFAQRDVDPSRLDFIGVRGTHLQHYNEIDIALDTLPHVGGTTTCESLWMGVPTISLVGAGFPERLSYSNLNNAGVGDLATFSTQAYVDKAAELASDPARRLHLRSHLRPMMLSHPLGQSTRFVQDFYQLAHKVASQ
jgi:predicted O-linked N-acetylglucosamine transferase (SPINDLY family)